jgi:nickel transport protein
MIKNNFFIPAAEFIMRHVSGFLRASLMLLALPAAAHDLWLEKDGSRYALYQGHRHSSHAGAEVVAYEPGSVKGAICLDAGGGTKALPVGKAYPVRFSGECAALLVSFSTGYWTKTAWETKNLPKAGITGVIKSWRSEDGVKRIDTWNAASAQPLGAGLEITPTTDPTRIAIGDKLTLRVTEGKKPKAGVAVAYQGDTRGTTGEDGRIAIRIRQGGLQLISASTEESLSDGKADTVIRASTLQFEVAK